MCRKYAILCIVVYFKVAIRMSLIVVCLGLISTMVWVMLILITVVAGIIKSIFNDYLWEKGINPA